MSALAPPARRPALAPQLRHRRARHRRSRERRLRAGLLLPGYLRGLAFAGEYALVGLSQCREERTFSGLELDDRLREKGAEARCGLMIIDLRTGSIAHWLDFAGTVRELYDVQVIPGVRCPTALGLRSKEVWGVVTHDLDGRVVRHTGIPGD